VIPAYPGMSMAAALIVVVVELAWLRTGIFRLRSYWVAMAVVFAFQIPIDGWMTKLSDPIVIYNPDALSGLRFPLDIPTEEFAYAFAMVTLAIMCWERAGPASKSTASEPAPAEPGVE
jgi:lycopene cyclase domain-containing protein